MTQVALLHSVSPAETKPVTPRRGLGLAPDPGGLLVRARKLVGQGPLIGEAIRNKILFELVSKVLLRRCSDTIGVVGPEGTGKHHLASFIHDTVGELLDRRGGISAVHCTVERARRSLDRELSEALERARGGTLVIDGFEALSSDEQRTVGRIVSRAEDVLTIVLTSAPIDDRPAWPSACIELEPLFERGGDVEALAQHFASEALEACGQRGLALSETLSVLTDYVREARIESVDRLRDLVRDVVFGAFASPEPQQALAAGAVRAQLERLEPSEPTIWETGDEDLGLDLDPGQLDELAEIHGVSPAVLARQVAICRALAETLPADVPKSFRNLMDRTDVIRRVGLWIASGAACQAEFRRSFGEERFMQPSKSSAWAFYNTVFKRDD